MCAEFNMAIVENLVRLGYRTNFFSNHIECCLENECTGDSVCIYVMLLCGLIAANWQKYFHSCCEVKVHNKKRASKEHIPSYQIIVRYRVQGFYAL